ncbi:MAG: zinc metallopeptidase, partial [Flavobacteriaceae bacterium]|nr:zinc metallopeptidase [Flavobacteriaceae bacterium]
VAAHEVGHAVQHATAYSWLQMRSQMVPVVSVASGLSTWIIFAGIVLMASGGGQLGFLISIIGLLLMAMATAFSFVTLPVEYDASKRALLWLEKTNMLEQKELMMAKDALKWAARTYVVAALGALASLLYWAIQILGSRD